MEPTKNRFRRRFGRAAFPDVTCLGLRLLIRFPSLRQKPASSGLGIARSYPQDQEQNPKPALAPMPKYSKMVQRFTLAISTSLRLMISMENLTRAGFTTPEPTRRAHRTPSRPRSEEHTPELQPR